MDFYWLMLLIWNTSSLLLHFRSELYTLRRRAHCQITLFKNVFFSCLPEGKLSCLTTDDVCSSLGFFFFVVFFLNLLVWFWFGVSMFFAVLLFAFGHFNCLFLVIFARATHNETRSALRQQQQLDFRVTTYHYPLLCACVCVVCARVCVK